MTCTPDWLPKLVTMSDARNDWHTFINAVYKQFRLDFITSQPRYQGLWVRCRRDPIYDGKEAGFWHCTSEGPDESTRVPDLRRCERIAWVRAIIENADSEQVLTWQDRKHRDQREYLWFSEQFLVVLGRRKYWQLITAFTTDREHTIEKLRKKAGL